MTDHIAIPNSQRTVPGRLAYLYLNNALIHAAFNSGWNSGYSTEETLVSIIIYQNEQLQKLYEAELSRLKKPAPRRKPPAVMPKRRKINEGDVKPRRPIRGKP